MKQEGGKEVDQLLNDDQSWISPSERITMAKTVADVLLDVLVEHGVEYIFSIPGDSIDPLLDPLRRDRPIRFVQVHQTADHLLLNG